MQLVLSLYREVPLLADSGWVDIDLGFSTVCPVWLVQMAEPAV